MALLMTHLDGGFHPHSLAANSINCIRGAAPLSPDLEEVNVSEIFNLLSNTTDNTADNLTVFGCSKSSDDSGDSGESGDSDSSNIGSPSSNPPTSELQKFEEDESDITDKNLKSPTDGTKSDSDCSSPAEPNLELRSGLSVQDITAEYDSKLIASRGMKKRGRKPSIKSWRRKKEYSELLKKVIETYQCENTTLKYEAIQLERTKREMLKILEQCNCRNSENSQLPDPINAS